MPFEVIFFDIDGTLMDHDMAVRLATRQLWDWLYPDDPPEFSAFHALWQGITDKHIKRYLRGEISMAEQRRCRMRELIGPGVPEKEVDALAQRYVAYYESNWRLYDDVLPCMRAIEDSRVGIISNGDSIQQRDKLKLLGAEVQLDPVVISGDDGIAKPDSRIFIRACCAAGALPGQCAYIGDQLDGDARAAQAAGLTGVWLRREIDDAPTPDDLITIHRLVECQDSLRACPIPFSVG